MGVGGTSARCTALRCLRVPCPTGAGTWASAVATRTRDGRTAVLVFLVTGVSGAGKSTVARRLAAWGHRAISLDADNRLCSWMDVHSYRVVRPELPDTHWLTLLLGPVAMWATPTAGLQGKDVADAVNATRQTLLAAGGGIVLLIGAAFTARTYHLSRGGQLTTGTPAPSPFSLRTNSPSGWVVSMP